MCSQPNIASTAFLIADPARATMLMALVDGRALPAGELAYAAGVTAQTASTHLAGPLGMQWMNLLYANGSLQRGNATRAVQVTPQGWVWLKDHLGIEGRLGELTQAA